MEILIIHKLQLLHGFGEFLKKKFKLLEMIRSSFLSELIKVQYYNTLLLK